MRAIALEEHFVTRAFMEGPGRGMEQMLEAYARSSMQTTAAQIIDRLLDLGQGRVSEMRAAGIDMQILSMTRGVEGAQDDVEAARQARDSNEVLAEAARRYPTSFAGFASLPVLTPDKAADELEWSVRELGLKGAMIHGHSRGRYLDDRYFWPILSRAEELGVPIYLHPTPPPEAVIKANYVGNYPKEVTSLFSIAGWGWHTETALHVMRIVLGGAFDAHPKLQLIVGHLGEALPFMLPRIEHVFQKQITKLDRPIGDYFRQNVSYTFSGFNYTPSFLNLLLQVGVERIMFSADYPYSSMAEARGFLDRIPVSPADREKIAHENAESLLRLNVR